MVGSCFYILLGAPVQLFPDAVGTAPQKKPKSPAPFILGAGRQKYFKNTW